MMAMQAHYGTVLIVDDTPGNLALLSDTLADAHYRVLVATDGQSAIEQIAYMVPDIILLDVMMPGIDGFETCNRLKADPSTAAIPVLFMTGLSELEHLLRGFDEGALDYIVKPIRPAEVLARIELHLAQTRNLRRAERLLAESAFAAVAIDSTGQIKWLTPAGKSALQALAQSHNQAFTESHLPTALLTVFNDWRSSDNPEAISVLDRYSVHINACEQPNEYLLLLQHSETVNEWDPETLRDKLKLTTREAEILMWIARGKTNKEIGLILTTSPRTVNKHLEHIFEKLGVTTRAAAVAVALQTESH